MKNTKRILSLILCLAMVIGYFTIGFAAAEETKTVTMDIFANKGTLANKVITWTSDDVTFSTAQGGNNNAIRTSDSDHFRVYASNTVTISAPGKISKIVITCTGTSYVTPLKNSLSGYTVSDSGSAVTITGINAESFTFTASAQIRLKKVEVTYSVSSVCEHANKNTVTVDATCTKAGSVTVICADCGKTISTEEIAATGHSHAPVVTPPSCTEDGYTTYTCPACGDSYTEEGEGATGHNYVDNVCSVCGDIKSSFKVNFVVPGGVTAPDQQGVSEALPGLENAGDYIFVGWATEPVEKTSTKPVIYEAGSFYPDAEADVTLYAVYSTGTAGGTAFEKTEISDIKATDVVVITMTSNGNVYAMSNDMGTSKPPVAVKVTVNGTVLSGDIADNLKWNIVNSNGKLTIYPNGTTAKWLYCTATNNGVRVGTNTNKEFTIDATTGYLKHTATVRYLGVYSAQDWRCYTNTTGNTANQTLGFYVLSAGNMEYTSTICAEHSYETEVTAPTCTEAGVITYTCANCGHSYTEAGEAATGHLNTTTTTVDATCTEAGSVTVTCDDCGATVSTQKIDMIAHNYVDGICSACGDVKLVIDTTKGYYIAAIRSSGNYWYMTCDLGTAKTKRYTAVDSGLTELPAAITEADEACVFYLVDNGDGTYSMMAFGVDGDNYLGWTSDNSGILVSQENAIKFTIEKAEEGTVNIHFTAGEDERYLALNNSSGNDYFAWYKSGSQKQNLVLIPVEAELHEHVPVYETTETTHQKKCDDCSETMDDVIFHDTKGENGVCSVCGYAVDAEVLTQAILDAAFALAPGATMPGTHTLTGVITSIDTAWDAGYNNITVTIEVNGKSIKCFRMGSGAADASTLAVGNTITVTGSIVNYANETNPEGIVEFAQGCVLDAVVAHVCTPGEAVIENNIDATCGTAGSYDNVVYCTGCGTEMSRETVTVAPTGAHSYAYTDNGDNTHTYACPGCGDATTSEHSYNENNECACGHALFVMKSGSSATLVAMLQLDFIINPEQMTGTDNYAILTRTYADGPKKGQTDVVRIDQADWSDYSGNRKAASYTNIAAKEMGDEITIVLYNAKGQQLSVPKTDSIMAYAYRGLAALKNTTDAKNIKLRTMLADMLNYGASAQLYFHYNEANLVNANMTETQQSWATQNDIATTNNADNGVGGRSRTLTLESAIQLDFIFYSATVGTEDKWDDMYAIATYVDHYGNNKTVRVEGEQFTNFGKTTDVQISVVGMAVADYQSLVTCVVYDANGNEVGRSVDSIEGYANRATNAASAGADLKVMLKALVKFSAAADAYFA